MCVLLKDITGKLRNWFSGIYATALEISILYVVIWRLFRLSSAAMHDTVVSEQNRVLSSNKLQILKFRGNEKNRNVDPKTSCDILVFQ